MKVKIFLGVKTALMYLLMIHAGYQTYKQYKWKNKVIWVIIFYILILTALLVFEFVSESIPLLFYAKVASMGGQIYMLKMMLDACFKYT